MINGSLVQFLFSLLLLSIVNSSSSGEDYIKRLIGNCCKAGILYADQWPSKGCNTIANEKGETSNLITGQYKSTCEITFSLCCSSRHQLANCDLGKAFSKTGDCIPSISYTRYSDHRDIVYECCQACKLGTSVRLEGKSCSLPDDLQFTKNWIRAFNSCCLPEEDEELSSASSSSSSSSPEDVNLAREREREAEPNRNVICENGYLQSNEKCICKNGYRLDESGSTCIDINECTEYAKVCPTWQYCLNTIGSFSCTDKLIANPTSQFPPNQHDSHPKLSPSPMSACLNGYTHSASGSCVDIDECTREPPVCHPTLEKCVNLQGSYQCVTRSPLACTSGYRSIGSQCVDIDECSIGMHRCKPSIEDCINLPGSYECQNRMKNGRIREEPSSSPTSCALIADQCEDTHRCIDMAGSAVCIRKKECGTGYFYNVTSDRCDDIDECNSSPGVCGSLTMFKCINDPGTYRCVRIACPEGQILQSDQSCRSIQCPNGFEKDEYGTCVDIDECRTLPGQCPVGFSCINLIGTYRCRSNCESGLRYDNTNGSCIDIDECAEGRHNCGPGQTCSNTYRTFSCSCPRGQQLDVEGRFCVDVDECAKYGSSICPINSICVNSQGSFDCICEKGYRQSTHSQGCDDVDECQETPWVCPHKCINTQGSYICSCPPGYRLADDDKTCKDIDECAENKLHLALFCEGKCNNTEGSYTCTCSEGFQARENRFCDDINECIIDNPCGQEICLNTIGGYKCFDQDCPEGYIRDVTHTHRCKKPRRSVQCVGDQCYEIYKEPLSYSYSYISLPSETPIPSSGRLALFTARGPMIPGAKVLFKLNVTSIEADNSTEPANEDHFHLNSAYNEAVISLVKPLKGEQLAKLELDLELFQGDLPSGVTKIILMLHVSKYSIGQSRRYNQFNTI